MSGGANGISGDRRAPVGQGARRRLRLSAVLETLGVVE
jgi:hypothetical protein